jgi:pentatricopeptide repeat protein
LLVNAYGLNGMGIEAIELFRQMPSELINEATYVCVLNGCSHSGLVGEARAIFNNIQIKTESIYTTMVWKKNLFLNKF